MSSPIVDSILSSLGNTLSGGVVGFIGSLGSSIVGLFASKAQFAHDETMADKNLALKKLDYDAQADAAKANYKLTEEQQAGQAFTASQIGGNQFSNLPGWASGILSWIRPAITGWLLYQTAICYRDADADTRKIIVQSILALTGIAVGWWYGDRSVSKRIAAKILPDQ